MPLKRKYGVNCSNLENIYVKNKKHTLDTDEEDSDDYEKEDLCESDIEGAEDGVSKIQDETKITPFNMKEELEEGHFDKEGHYHWNKSVNDVKDNWLDNVDWIKIKNEKKNLKKNDADSAIKSVDIYNETLMYKQLLSYMFEGETVAGSLLRLGKNRPKISTLERSRLKKKGIEQNNGDEIIKLTGLANEILSKTGNMDIYEVTYEQIKEKLNSVPCTSRDSYNFLAPKCDIFLDDSMKTQN